MNIINIMMIYRGVQRHPAREAASQDFAYRINIVQLWRMTGLLLQLERRAQQRTGRYSHHGICTLHITTMRRRQHAMDNLASSNHMGLAKVQTNYVFIMVVAAAFLPRKFCTFFLTFNPVSGYYITI